MTLLSTSSHLIKVGQDYSAGSGISIDNHVISVTGGTGTTYSAGDNIEIYEQDEQLYISSKDWTNDIANASANAYNAATAQIPEPQDLSYISSKVDDKLDSTAFTNWQTGQYTTDLQTIEGQITNKLDTSSFSEVSANFYTNDNPSGFITGVNLSNYYTKDETSGKEELANAFANIPVGDPEVNAYVTNNSASINGTKSLVQSNSSTWNDITVYQSNSANYLTGVDLTPYVPTSSIGTKYSTTSVFGGETFVTAISGFRINASSADYASTAGGAEEAVRARSAIYANYDYEGNNLVADHNSLTALNNVVQTNSAQWGNETISSYTTTYSHDIPPYGDFVINSLNGKFLSAFVSKSAEEAEVATNANTATYALTVDETKLENDGFVKNLSSDYGTISVVRNTIESTNSAIARTGNEGFVSSFGTTGIGPSVTANFSWDKSLPNTTFNFTESYAQINTKIYYSANTNLTGEVTVTAREELQFSIEVPNATELNVWANDWIQIKNNVASAADSFETVFGELAWASALPTYEYDNTNKISAINGSAIAGGGDVPTGTMNVSGLEYNAVNEISAYNGSAIAQYGAEKQWLVHDDTLVHLSNSAQYALGVNLSAVSGLLLNLFGLDETMLWSGSNSTTSVMNFSEPYSSFKKLRFEYKDNNDISCEQVVPTENINTNIVLTSFWTNTANGSFLKPSLYQISSNGIQLKNGCEYSFSNSYSRAGTSNKLTMTKIYGIGRKA